MLLGLFDDPFNRISWDEIDLESHRAAARKTACESAVLLKNDKNTLPLETDEPVLLVGAWRKRPRNGGYLEHGRRPKFRREHKGRP